MNQRHSSVFLSLAIFLISGQPVLAQYSANGANGDGTLMLSQPAVSRDRMAFAYAGDLWTFDIDGGGARRLTSLPPARVIVCAIQLFAVT